MSREHLRILYVGELERGRALAAAVEPRGWLVYLPAEMMEALGMYIFYYPDVVVVDLGARPITGLETFYHMQPVAVSDGVPLVVLGDEGRQYVPGGGCYVLPAGLDVEALAAALADIVQGIDDVQPTR